MRCTIFFYQTKVVTNHNLQLLCYVTFFDILHHYGVIAASLICSVSRKYCAVLQNRFLLSRLYEVWRKYCICPKNRLPDFDECSRFEGHWVQKSYFWNVVCVSVCLSVGLSVCLSVCVSVCGHYNSKNNWASSTKFGMWSYMIKISVGIAYEQNRPTGVASALRAQFGFWAKSALKMHCTKLFFRQKLLQITICNFCCKDFFDRCTGVASVLMP